VRKIALILSWILLIIQTSCGLLKKAGSFSETSDLISPEAALEKWAEGESTVKHFFISSYSSTLRHNQQSEEKFRGYIKGSRKGDLLMTFASMAGIEGGRMILTEDEVYFINRIDKTYYSGPAGTGSAIMGLPADADWIRQVLLCQWYPPDVRKPESLSLRLENGGTGVYVYEDTGERKEDGLTKIMLNAASGRVASVRSDRKDGSTIMIDYLEYRKTGEVYFPERIAIVYETKTNHLAMELRIKKWEEWWDAEVKVRIPESYQRINHLLP
jgi:hypothetical protein